MTPPSLYLQTAVISFQAAVYFLLLKNVSGGQRIFKPAALSFTSQSFRQYITSKQGVNNIWQPNPNPASEEAHHDAVTVNKLFFSKSLRKLLISISFTTLLKSTFLLHNETNRNKLLPGRQTKHISKRKTPQNSL